MNLPACDAQGSPLGLTAVLQAAAAELTHWAGVADSLGVYQAGDAERWQSMDRMSQHLGELSAFLAAVSFAVPDLHPDLADALAAIRVGRLVQRLTAGPASAEEEAPGEIEMFGN